MRYPCTPARMAKIKTGPPPMPGRMQRLHHGRTAGGNGRWLGPPGKLSGGAVQYLACTELMTQQPHFPSQRNGSLWSHKTLYTDAHSKLICNRPKLETTQKPSNECTVKLRGTPTVENYSVTIKVKLAIYATTWVDLRTIMLSTKCQSLRLAHISTLTEPWETSASKWPHSQL